MLYDRDMKIQANCDNEIESEDDSLQAELCPYPPKLSSLSVERKNNSNSYIHLVTRDFHLAKLHTGFKYPEVNALDSPEELPGAKLSNGKIISLALICIHTYGMSHSRNFC